MIYTIIIIIKASNSILYGNPFFSTCVGKFIFHGTGHIQNQDDVRGGLFQNSQRFARGESLQLDGVGAVILQGGGLVQHKVAAVITRQRSRRIRRGQCSCRQQRQQHHKGEG